MIIILILFQKKGFLKNCNLCEIKQTQAENNVQAVYIFMEETL